MNKPLRHFGAGFPGPDNRYAFDILELRSSDLECVTSNPQALSNQHVRHDRFETALPDRFRILDKAAGRARFQRILLDLRRLTLLRASP